MKSAISSPMKNYNVSMVDLETEKDPLIEKFAIMVGKKFGSEKSVLDETESDKNGFPSAGKSKLFEAMFEMSLGLKKKQRLTEVTKGVVEKLQKKKTSRTIAGDGGLANRFARGTLIVVDLD